MKALGKFIDIAERVLPVIEIALLISTLVFLLLSVLVGMGDNTLQFWSLVSLGSVLFNSLIALVLKKVLS